MSENMTRAAEILAGLSELGVERTTAVQAAMAHAHASLAAAEAQHAANLIAYSALYRGFQVAGVQLTATELERLAGVTRSIDRALGLS